MEPVSIRCDIQRKRRFVFVRDSCVYPRDFVPIHKLFGLNERARRHRLTVSVSLAFDRISHAVSDIEYYTLSGAFHTKNGSILIREPIP